jgi:hypothetical protein
LPFTKVFNLTIHDLIICLTYHDLVANEDLTWCHHIPHGWCIWSTYTLSYVDHSYKVGNYSPLFATML